jgi:hypothetical protein
LDGLGLLLRASVPLLTFGDGSGAARSTLHRPRRLGLLISLLTLRDRPHPAGVTLHGLRLCHRPLGHYDRNEKQRRAS